MKNTEIFKPTPTYKKFTLLTIIANNSEVSQREIAKEMEISVSMVNNYLDEYENDGLIIRNYQSIKTVTYTITPKGEELRKYLNIQYLIDSYSVYKSAKDECMRIIDNILKNKHKNILMYGAGEVCSILLNAIDNSESIINVLALVDDNKDKQNTKLVNRNIISIDDISKYDYDGILISTYSNNDSIKAKLKEHNIDDKYILEFFK